MATGRDLIERPTGRRDAAPWLEIAALEFSEEAVIRLSTEEHYIEAERILLSARVAIAESGVPGAALPECPPLWHARPR